MADADTADIAADIRPAPPPAPKRSPAPALDPGNPMIEFGHLTHTGLRRDLNEDTYYGDSEDRKSVV